MTISLSEKFIHPIDQVIISPNFLLLTKMLFILLQVSEVAAFHDLGDNLVKYIFV